MIDDQHRQRARECSEAYRDRRRHGRLILSIEVAPHQLAALERLALLDAGERDKSAIASAVMRFLNAASHVGALGDALWPEGSSDEGLAA